MSDQIYLSRQQVREVDRRAIEEYHIPGIVLMENAARGAAEVAANMLGQVRGSRVMILCGGGNNGGDGLAIARHLHNQGFAIQIALCVDPARYSGDALINWNIVKRMALPAESATADLIRKASADLIIDAIFGTGLQAEPRPPFAEWVEAVHAIGRQVLAVDLPSGLDCDRGVPLGSCIRATRTVTFVALKLGFANPASRQFTGDLSVADIGAPPEIVRSILMTVRQP